MTLMIHLPEQIERAYFAAAEERGVSMETLVAELLVTNSPVFLDAGLVDRRNDPPQNPEWIREMGIPVLRTGIPLAASTASETLAQIRLERESTYLS